MKFVVVTGGTISGIGKGTAISSLGKVLQTLGFPVTAIKIDPYLNVDAGTMSPYEHGEVFVLEDGGECDLDLGNYERFMDLVLTKEHNLTTGKIYAEVLERERRGDYLGKTVQMIPHITDAIQERILSVAANATFSSKVVRRMEIDDQAEVDEDKKIVLIEVGGTVGDLESAVYLEALRQLTFRVGAQNMCNIHVGFIPTVGNEQKSKPCQASMKLLREAGLVPDFLFGRTDSESPVTNPLKEKLVRFGHLSSTSHVISMHRAPSPYHVPLWLHEQNAGELVLQRLGLTVSEEAKEESQRFLLETWKVQLTDRAEQLLLRPPSQETTCIALVGKYTESEDAYLSVIRALQHAALKLNVSLRIVKVETESIDVGSKENARLVGAHGVLVPGGFGERGVECKIAVAGVCLEEKVPYLGICLGMQVAVIAAARRRMADMADANSTEFNTLTAHPVIIHMPETAKETKMGGTMRLGTRWCMLDQETRVYDLYDREGIAASRGLSKKNKLVVSERHRHRYEVNPEYVDRFQKETGLRFSGRDADTRKRMEVVEVTDPAVHPFFVGVQFHPEFSSRPMYPHPLFEEFVAVCAGKSFVKS